MACPSGCLNGGGQIKFDYDVTEDLKAHMNNTRVRQCDEQMQLDALVG
jgi:iron only hydrogenase large subunit-like protein